jgi:hypothetical protein
MKRILNLNGIVGRVGAAILALTLLVPGGLWLLGRLFPSADFSRLGRFSLGAGLALLGLFALLVVLEMAQDAWIDDQHRRGLGKRLRLPGPTAECPYCGSRQIRPFDRACPVCGKDLS